VGCAIEPEFRSTRARRPRFLFITVVLAGIGCSLILLASRTSRVKDVHRFDPVSPYQNTRAGVKYLGDATCARCHAADPVAKNGIAPTIVNPALLERSLRDAV